MNDLGLICRINHAIRDAMEEMGSFEAMVKECHNEIVKSRDRNEQLALASLSEEEREAIAWMASKAADDALLARSVVARADDERRAEWARESYYFWSSHQDGGFPIGSYENFGQLVYVWGTEDFPKVIDDHLRRNGIKKWARDEFLNAVEESIRLAQEACGPQETLAMTVSFDRFAPTEDGADLVQSRPQGDCWVAGSLTSPFGPRFYARPPTEREVSEGAIRLDYSLA